VNRLEGLTLAHPATVTARGLGVHCKWRKGNEEKDVENPKLRKMITPRTCELSLLSERCGKSWIFSPEMLYKWWAFHIYVYANLREGHRVPEAVFLPIHSIQVVGESLIVIIN